MKRLLTAFAFALLVFAQPAYAQSILRDAETEALLNDMAAPLVKAAGLDPRHFDVVLVQDPTVNAFVIGGQAVYINSGLIGEADNANQVQGVIAHEIGHVVGGHVIAGAQQAADSTKISILSLLLGLGAMAAGAGEGGAGILAAGQQAALYKYLAYSRVQESSADAAGASYLHKAGVSGRGSLEFFKKLQGLEFRYGFDPQQADTFASTHPMTADRIAILSDIYTKDPAWDTPTSDELEQRFERVKAKLFGYVADPPRVIQKYPETDHSIEARYARAIAYHKGAYSDQALAEMDLLLKDKPDDPYFLELRGQIQLESGHPEAALSDLREAFRLTNAQPLIATLFGHALVATEDRTNLDEAEKVLRAAVTKDHDNAFAWLQLGTVYEQKGDHARAALASAERFRLMGEDQLAVASAREAMAGTPPNSPDWIRAQDIAMVSTNAIEKDRKRK